MLLLVHRLHYGFLPHDDPGFSYLAERALHGELPNVDFYDDYTGGLSYLNALALQVFGIRLISARIMLLIFFVPWTVAVWYLASRMTSYLNATVATLLAASWSVPVYPTPYGTWYNLYFATFGTAALFRFLDTGRRRYIFWAGVCGGLSFLAKIFGLYFIAAAGLFLIFDEQNESTTPDPQPNKTWSAYSIFITLGLIAFAAALVRLIGSAGGPIGFTLARLYQFVVPTVSVCTYLVFREWSVPRIPARVRIASFISRLVPLLVGAFLPLAVFLLPYLRRHVVGQWFESILVSRTRVHLWSSPPMSIWFAFLCVPLLIVLLVNAESKHPTTRKIVVSVLSVLLGLLIIATPRYPLLCGLAWYSVAELLPLLVMAVS